MMAVSNSNSETCNNTKEWHIEYYLQLALRARDRTTGATPSTSNASTNPTTEESQNNDSDARILPFILFCGIRYSRYMRVKENDENKLIWGVLRSEWEIHHPNLLISVTGEAKLFGLQSRLRTILKQGLITAAVTSDAWIITGSTAVDGMTFVGGAVQDHVTSMDSQRHSGCKALGVATWSAVSFERNEEHNHTDFVLVHNGTGDAVVGKIKFRYRLESDIVNNWNENNQKVPCVLVVIGGGENTLKTFIESANQNIPVVIIEGSGSVADLIAYAYRITDPNAAGVDFSNDGQFHKCLQIKAGEITKLQIIDQQPNKELLRVFTEKRYLLNIFDFKNGDSVNDLVRIILKTSLRVSFRNAKEASRPFHIHQAILWDCYDIAEEEIVNSALSQNGTDNTNDTNVEQFRRSNPLTALTYNRTDFVQRFIDKGLNLKEFLTKEKLYDLYKKCLQQNPLPKEVEVLHNLIIYTKHHWCTRWFLFNPSEKYEPKIETLLPSIGTVVVFLLDDEKFNFYSEVTSTFDYPERELLLWAVLLNRDQLVDLFWRKGRDHMGGALFIAALSMSLSEFAKKNGIMAESFDNQARKYEKLAATLLTQCASNYGQQRAHQLLVRKLRHWVGHQDGSCTSVLTLAKSYGMMDFTLEPTTKTKLNTIWRGKMAPLTSRLLIFFTTFMPFLLFFIKFTDVPGCCLKCCNNSVGQENSTNEMNNFKTVRLRSCSEENICFADAFRFFHLAPITKFIFEYILYGVFLCLFSYFVLVELGPPSEPNVPSVSEILTLVWVGTLVTEEIRQLTTTDKQFFRHKVMTWRSTSWNQFDLIMLTMLILSVILRFTLTAYFVWARIMYSLTLGVFFLRLLYYFYANSDVGPKVVMIRQMLTDLKIFILLLIIFVLSFGVTYHANMFPHSPPSWEILVNVLYFPYFQTYGELFLDQVKGEDSDGCTRNESVWRENIQLRCPEKNGLVPTLTAVYLMLTMILLVNILIAMLNHTFSELHKDSAKIWNYYMLSLVYEYSDRPPLAPPLIFFTHIYRFFNNFYQWMRGNDTRRTSFFKYLFSKRETPFNMDISQQKDTMLTMTERICMEKINLDTPISTTNNG